jgi:Domain of unknown function (DUF4294)
MPQFRLRYVGLFLTLFIFVTVNAVFAQQPGGKPSDTSQSENQKKKAVLQQFNSRFGKYDTIWSQVIVYEGDTIPARTLPAADVYHEMTRAMRRRMEAMTRLRNAVYVTYPYARKAGMILNDMNAHLATMSTESEKKDYIRSKEKELKKEFTDPMEKLSVYQGKVLMKLINRQTGNNCYDIIKEYRGSFSARLWQTVAFFFGSSLKQSYDASGDDHDIEVIVQEVERMYRG